ncbi:MAG: hypothetical protein GEU99_24600 [Luteitalea sp.]|nr:hypothetical protein [Luteitalea sp.]
MYIPLHRTPAWPELTSPYCPREVRNMNYRWLLVGLLGLISSLELLLAQTRRLTRDDIATVRPTEIHDVFTNPGKGFVTFQRFNGDTTNALRRCCGDFKEDYPLPVLRDEKGHLINTNYPNTSIAYLRWYWRFLEPEHGRYRWDTIDRALETARERGQTLLLAVAPHGTPGRGQHDVPDWYRQMVGERTAWAHDSPVNGWTVDAEDPRYAKYYGGFIRKIGERYDGHPDLEAVDVRIVGAWGEGAGSALLTQQTREVLVNAYSDTFKKTPLIMLLTDERTNTYGLSQADMGWRVDCLGDLRFWADDPDKDGWTHMYDHYPRAIIQYGMRDAWKQGPVSLEICGTFPTWKEREGYGLEQVEIHIRGGAQVEGVVH